MEKEALYILNGEDAVNEYEENGVKGCIKQGYNDVVKIEVDEQSNVLDVVREVLVTVSGSLGSCLISEEDYNKIQKAF